MRAVLLDVTDLDVVGLAKEAIRKQILAIEDANYEVESPFTTAIDVKALRVGGNEQGVVIANIFDRIDLFTDTVIRMEERLKSIEINSEYVRRPIEPRGLGLLGRSLHSRGLDEVSDSFGINPDPSYLEKLIGLQRANDALDPKKAVRSTSNAPEKKKAIF
ncbi:hypothetical protein [Glacieibacterium sp.]|uniref:hypothetical protein n=1 Tax=Glacieibacterium sp. TaxID=2860237 RepID=UPI003AFF9085